MGETSNAMMAGLAPHLTIRGGRCAEAIEFYKKAFAAEEVARMPAEDGKRIMHAHLKLNGAHLLLMDDFPEHVGGRQTPAPAAVILHLQVDDADRWFARAVNAGAVAKMPLADQFWGDRYGQIQDPFGHAWSIGAPVRK